MLRRLVTQPRLRPSPPQQQPRLAHRFLSGKSFDAGARDQGLDLARLKK